MYVLLIIIILIIFLFLKKEHFSDFKRVIRGTIVKDENLDIENANISIGDLEDSSQFLKTDTMIHLKCLDKSNYYLNVGDKRQQSAWFRWKFNNPLKYHFVIND